MAIPKPIPKPIFQAIALVLLLATFGVVGYWAATFSGPWAEMAAATSASDGTYDLTITALVSWLPTFVAWLIVIVPLRILTPFPSMKSELAKLDGGLFGSKTATKTPDAKDDPTLASPFMRVLACVIDRTLVVVVLLLGVMPAMLFEPDHAWNAARITSLVVAIGALLFVVAYAWARDAIGGRSIGRRLLGIQVVDARTREPIGAWRSFKREVPLHVSPLPLIELVMLFATKDQRRIGDRWADTIVVRRGATHVAIDGVAVGAHTTPRGDGWGQPEITERRPPAAPGASR